MTTLVDHYNFKNKQHTKIANNIRYITSNNNLTFVIKNIHSYRPKTHASVLNTTISSISPISPISGKIINHQDNKKNNIKIKEWSMLKLPLDKMIIKFEDSKHYWLNSNTEDLENLENLDRMNIIKFLSKAHRSDVLYYLIKHYPEFEKILFTKDNFTPLHYAVWSSKKTIVNSDSIINTINILITEYKYNIFSMYEKEQNGKFTYETVLGALLSKNNLLNDTIKMQIYNYIINGDHRNWFIPEFRNILYKIDQYNYLKYMNKLIFILCNYTSDICPILFKYLLGVKISKIEECKQIEFIINILTSKPTDTDNELDSYFDTVKFSYVYDEMIDIILENADEWINIDNIENKDEISLEDLEVINITSRKTNEINYKIYYSILGSFYKRSINKTKILEYSWILKATIQFICHAKLNYKHLNNQEKKLITEFTNKYFNTNTKLHDRFNIGYVLSLMYYNYDNSESNKILSSEQIKKLFL